MSHIKKQEQQYNAGEINASGTGRTGQLHVKLVLYTGYSRNTSHM